MTVRDSTRKGAVLAKINRLEMETRRFVADDEEDVLTAAEGMRWTRETNKPSCNALANILVSAVWNQESGMRGRGSEGSVSADPLSDPRRQLANLIRGQNCKFLSTITREPIYLYILRF